MLLRPLARRCIEARLAGLVVLLGILGVLVGCAGSEEQGPTGLPEPASSLDPPPVEPGSEPSQPPAPPATDPPVTPPSPGAIPPGTTPPASDPPGTSPPESPEAETVSPVKIPGGPPRPAPPRVFYAAPSPIGQAGNAGTSRDAPTTVESFLKYRSPRPGDTLILLDGLYQAPEDMIRARFSEGVLLRGTPDKPIVIRAENEGRVTINGNRAYAPIALEGGDQDFPNQMYQWVKIAGVNACNSSGTVVSLTLCQKCVLHRVCAWDASGYNQHVFQIYRGRDNLLSDCAGWGRGRKIFSVYGPVVGGQPADVEWWSHNNVLRRCWGRWESWARKVEIGPGWGGGHGETYSYNYDCWDTHLENCIATFDARGEPGELVTPFALFLHEGCSNCPGFRDEGKLYGCIGYVQGPQVVYPGSAFNLYSLASSQRIKNCLAYVDPEQKYSPFVVSFALGPTHLPRAFEAWRLTVCGGTGFGGDANIGCDSWAFAGLLVTNCRDDGDTDHPSALGRRGDNVRDVWFYDNYPRMNGWANFGTVGDPLTCFNTPDRIHSPRTASGPLVKPQRCCISPFDPPGPEFNQAQVGLGIDPALRAPRSLLRARANPALSPAGAEPMGAHIMWEVDEYGEDTAVPLWPWPMNQRIHDLIGVNVTREVFELGGGAIPFDYDGDADVDAADWTQFQQCRSASLFDLVTGCEWADHDEDGDVDAGDQLGFEQWQAWSTHGRLTPLPDPPADDYGD